MEPIKVQYMTQMVKQIEAIKERKLSENELQLIQAEIDSSLPPSGKVTLYNTQRKMQSEIPPDKFFEWLLKTKPVMNGFGAFFKRHDEFHSIVGDLVNFLMEERGVSKKKMFELIRAGKSKDDPEVTSKDLEQKIYKLLANSFYGAFAEKNFHFYESSCGPSVTMTGRLIITSMIYGFDSFLTGNFQFKTPSDLYRFVYECANFSEGKDLDEWLTEGEYNLDAARLEVKGNLLKGCASGVFLGKQIDKVVSELSERQVKCLLFRGSPYKFFSLNKVKALLEISFDGVIQEGDEKCIGKHHPNGLVALDKIWQGLEDWVVVPFIPPHIDRTVEQMNRRSVILADTDSSFVCLSDWLDYVDKTMINLKEVDEEKHLTVLNVMVYFLIKYSRFQMNILTKNLWVPEDKRALILFKSEFVLKRVILTNGKKHYAGLVLYQEGAKINGGLVDIKGLAIKKSTIPVNTSKHFEKLLSEKILRVDEIDRTGMLQDIVQFSQDIAGDIESGHMNYSTPGRIGNVSAYKDRYAIPAIRGMTVWNRLYPAQEIREGETVNLFRIRALDVAEFTALMEGYDRELEVITSLFMLDTSDPLLAKNGFNWISIPKTISEIPLWLRKIIDVDNIVDTNISPILPILESTGIRTIRTSTTDTFSNIINF